MTIVRLQRTDSCWGDGSMNLFKLLAVPVLLGVLFIGGCNGEVEKTPEPPASTSTTRNQA